MEELTLETVVRDKNNLYGNDEYFSYKSEFVIKKSSLYCSRKQDDSKIKRLQNVVTEPPIKVKEAKYNERNQAIRALFEIKQLELLGNNKYILLMANEDSLKPKKVFFNEKYYDFILKHTNSSYMTIGNTEMGIKSALNFFNGKKEFIACLAPVRLDDFIGIKTP